MKQVNIQEVSEGGLLEPKKINNLQISESPLNLLDPEGSFLHRLYEQ